MPNITESDSTTPTSTNNNNLFVNRSFAPSSTVGNISNFEHLNRREDGGGGFDVPLDYSLSQSYESFANRTGTDKKNDTYVSGENTPYSGATPTSDSELDIYSDIETVSTSRVEEPDTIKNVSPLPISHTQSMAMSNDDDNNDSDTDLIIDTEKADQEKYDPASILESDDEKTKGEPVTSTVDSTGESISNERSGEVLNSNLEIQSNMVQSSNQSEPKYWGTAESKKHFTKDGSDEDELEDDCPNFSIYSTESINMAKSTNLTIMTDTHEGAMEVDKLPGNGDSSKEKTETRNEEKKDENNDLKENEKKAKTIFRNKKKPLLSKVGGVGLYSDSEDENVVKIDPKKPFGITDLQTEDISEEEERSYTPCLDEREPSKQGLEGLDTEMISDDDKNDFDDTNDPKGTSDGDALEINAKESELDFTRPEECEEGEIVDKGKSRTASDGSTKSDQIEDNNDKDGSGKENENTTNINDNSNNNNGSLNKDVEKTKETAFKKISKNNRERNYRENRSKSKDKERSRSDKENKKEKKKERRREIELYNVRSIVAEKPRRLKDQFGRDIVRRRSDSDSSGSPTPPRRVAREPSIRRSITRSHSRSVSPRRLQKSSKRARSPSFSPVGIRCSPSRSHRPRSKEKRKKTKRRSRNHRSRSRSRSQSRQRRRRSYRRKKRHRSLSKEKTKRRKSSERSRQKNKKARSQSRHRSSSPRSPSLRRRDWERRDSRGWTPSLSRSPTPQHYRYLSPSWTPPRMPPNQAVKPQNLTVILPNDNNKKKRDKKKKAEKKAKENSDKQKKRRRDRSPLPSKEVFASGNNILVSVSFNKDDNTRDVLTKKRHESQLTTRRLRKEKDKNKKTIRSEKERARRLRLANIKPVAIIDLERSPFREITPSPKDIIILTDSDNGDSNDLMSLQKAICDSSQQLASPSRSVANNYLSNAGGPKTPPEPQIKFSLSSKQSQMRPITNPLHEPDDIEEPMGVQEEEIDNRMNDVMHKGPNTPPEPPNSPPSSPDAYDPFDPTKSRTPTPEPPESALQSSSMQGMDENNEEMVDQANLSEKVNAINLQSTNVTPPTTFADIQPADSQSSLMPSTPDEKASPERSIRVIINQVVQNQGPIYSSMTSKSNQPLASVASSMITSTPVSGSVGAPRINILNSTILTPSNVSSSVPQRIVLPNTSRSSPVNKVSPSKTPIKSTPIKPMPVPLKNVIQKLPSTATNKQQSWKDKKDINLDFDSPYSPGSSDYEDLFEPPPETGTKKSSGMPKTTKSPAKNQSAFDQLFGSSPVYKSKSKSKPISSSKNKSKTKSKSLHTSGKGTKLVGVKMDEDNLKILDELPNSAVEMQVKDKFLKKLNRQERVVEEVKLVLKPHYNKKHVTKEEYKDILRRAVPKICHNKSGEINPKKIQALIEAYVRKVRHSKKVTSSSSVNQKTEVISNWLSKIN